MNYTEAVDYINNFTWSKTRLGLERTTELLEKLGNPQNDLKFVHVAGSNGKGSTCAMLENILRYAGYKTGMYISPYIEDLTESFQICGKNISEDELCRITQIVREAADSMEDHPSQFELKTAIAMQYFKDNSVDIVVLEVGMGGEFDSTNVIPAPEAAVITNIGLEHSEYLGNTLYEIAYAKAGIIKTGCDVISYNNKPDVIRVLDQVCMQKGCTLYRTLRSNLRLMYADIDGQVFTWNNGYDELEFRLALLGKHQLMNAAVVLRTCEVLNKRGYNITYVHIRKGLETVKWPARFEVMKKDPLFIIDGGHNPQCTEALQEIIKDYLPKRKFIFIAGILADKDYSSMIDSVAHFADEFICLTPDSPRALPAEKLAQVCEAKKRKAVVCGSPKEAVKLALDSGKDVIAFGSLYMAGGIRSAFRELMSSDNY